MVTPIVMPKFGQMTEESAVVEWLKKEGDTVAKGDMLFLVETDKSVMEVESFSEGTLLKIVVGAGVSVPVQSVVAYLGEKGEAVPVTAVLERRAPASAAPVPATAAPSWRSGAPAATVA
ncbi:MAG: biotin/lipoyl-containing protein, partial [Roseiarcus sp.]